MEEKIKIYIPEAVNNILLKDMERFEFYKNDGSFNKNEFYNTLIVNYYEQYQQLQSDIFNKIKNTITENIKKDERTINQISSKILEYVDIKTNKLDEQPSTITLSMKPTKKSSDIFSFISQYYLTDTTLSSYFRNMFTSYTLLPQDKRERIIFKQNFELIEKAIKDKRKIYFTTINNDNLHVASIYSICNSKEELFNYALADYNGAPFSFRIGHLKKITILNEPSNILEKNIPIFKKMEEQGPQYTINANEMNTTIKVQLSERGKQLFKNIYLHRPKCTKVEDDYYYFDCSIQQAFQYFCRFGSSALVIEPIELTQRLFNYYSSSKKTYNNYLYDNRKEENNLV